MSKFILKLFFCDLKSVENLGFEKDEEFMWGFGKFTISGPTRSITFVENMECFKSGLLGLLRNKGLNFEEIFLLLIFRFWF